MVLDHQKGTSTTWRRRGHLHLSVGQSDQIRIRFYECRQGYKDSRNCVGHDWLPVTRFSQINWRHWYCSHSVRVSPQLSNRLVSAARSVLNRYIPDVYIYTDVYRGEDSGKWAFLAFHGRKRARRLTRDLKDPPVTLSLYLLLPLPMFCILQNLLRALQQPHPQRYRSSRINLTGHLRRLKTWGF